MVHTPPLVPKPPAELSAHAPHNSSTSHLDLYFSGEVFHSPPTSDSDSESSNDSEATLDNAEVPLQFGHPLQRMFRVGSRDDDRPFFQGSLSRDSSSSFASNSSWSSTSSVSYDIDYEKLLDKLLKDNPSFDSQSPTMLLVKPSSPGLRDSLMIKCLPRASSELYILLELNHKELRTDPWNPVPHLRCAVERGDNVYLCMERLNPYDQPPFKTVANYIDFFRQMLEGLTFLHELKIANMTFQDPSCYMVDLSSAPSTCESPDEFDRTTYPVRYYFTNLSHAKKFDTPNAPAFRHDVQDCGVMVDLFALFAPRTDSAVDVAQVPRIEPKLKSLVKAMALGGFGADESRKLFEALCKSFESSTLDTRVLAPEQPVRCNTTLSIPKRSVPREVPPCMST
ncbi:hypothetical protein D9615_008826 [Tricholomella constricta]|uniref:Protein kinase domain-containing protein n=1 Tax=Tricholomella constricta TaxID=117010 RepID=A0A8H5GZF7_9AGAR|nr:hypothetical protein D9615_008826 [Tricholomella constricta]